MFHASGMGGKELKPVEVADLKLTSETEVKQLLQSHSESESIRHLAERLYNQRQRPNDRPSIAKFELHRETGMIELMIYDADTGEVTRRLTPEEVMLGFESLEQTRENDAPLSSFFIDVSF